MHPVDEYAGAFDGSWSLERLSRTGLARLCREIMLISMLHDRSLMPHIAERGGMDASVEQADDEWMSSSPIYIERNKAALSIDSDGVDGVLKSFQFDIGMPHHFLDMRGHVVDHDLGYFWLPYCGAHDYLRHLSGNDERVVTMMCHQMEDNTFDATLKVTNPRARCIPVHRPPKADGPLGGEHCRWEVRILPDGTAPREDHENLAIMRDSAAARLEIPLGPSREPGGLEDYRGEYRSGLRFEDFAHGTLVRQAKEFALDVHLLMRAAYLSVERRHGAEVLATVAAAHIAALAPPLVERLRAALRIDGDDAVAVAKILQVNPLLPWDYLQTGVEVLDDHTLAFRVTGGLGLTDTGTPSPLDLLRTGDPGFVHLAQAVNPRARATRAHPTDLEWIITIDPDAEPAAPHPLADLAGAYNYRTADLSARVPVPVDIHPTRRGS